MVNTKRRTKNIVRILVLVSLFIGFASVITSNIIVEQTNPWEVVFNYGRVNITMKPGSPELSQIILGDTFCRLNGTRFVVEAHNWTNITINSLAGNTSTYKVQGVTAFNFTANSSGGVVWFNLSGFPSGFVYAVYRNGTLLDYYTVNRTGVLSFSNSVWSWYYFTGSLYGGSGGAIRSDGQHLFYTCEDGILPYSYSHRGTHAIDANNTLEGKYCVNITYYDTTAVGTLIELFNLGSQIQPSSFAIKLKISVLTDEYIDFIVRRSTGSSLFGIRFKLDKTMLPITSSANDYFVNTWSFNSTYTIVFSDISYLSKSFDVAISNATMSESKNDKLFYTVSGDSLLSQFSFSGVTDSHNYQFFFDDWTVGTQCNITAGSTSSTSFNSTRVAGTLFNDGSLLQNRSEDNHTCKVLYDTVPEMNLSYTYYFNKHSNNTKLFENYTTGDDSYKSVYDGVWHGQTFTTKEKQNITYVKLLIYRVANPGIITLHIRETSGGLPIGTDIGTGTINGDTLTLDIAGEWRQINITNGCILQKNTKYAIMLSSTTTVPNYVRWRFDDHVDFYTGGTEVTSLDSGSSWAINFDDLLFEIYGEIFSQSDFLNDSSDDTYGSALRNCKIILTDHTGNNTDTPNKNISKIELRAKTNLSINNHNGSIYLQPVWNGINQTFFNTFANDNGGEWSDYIDITDYVNSSHPNWNDIRNLTVRVYANITSGIAYVGKVELRVTCNDSYAFNRTIMPENYANTTITDSFTQQIKNLSRGQAYFYRTLTNNSYYKDGYNYSSYSISTPEEWFLTKPQAPTNKTTSLLNMTHINLSWTRGNGSNRTVIVKKIGDYPTSPDDPLGIIVFNATNTSHNWTDVNVTINQGGFFRAWSYTVWNHTTSTGVETKWWYSDDYLTFNFSKMIITVYNESKPWQNISATITISNLDGSKAKTFTNVNTPYEIDLEGDEAPVGRVSFYITNSSYAPRLDYRDITLNVIYNFTSGNTPGGFYLAPLWTPGNTTVPIEDCTLRSLTDTISISNMAINAVITTTHDIDELISVEIYNDSLYGSYGGWIQVPSGQYSSNTTNVTIKYTALHDGISCCNTTMARCTYYYWYCPGETISTVLYRLRVVETIETDYTEVDRGVENIILHIARLLNTTGVFTDIATPLTDANGYCNEWLLPNTLYKVSVNDSLFEVMVSDYTTDPPNEYGQTLQRDFRVVRIGGSGSIPSLIDAETIFTNITKINEGNSTFTLRFCFLDVSGLTEWVRYTIATYNYSSLSWSEYALVNVSSYDFCRSLYNINNSNYYQVNITYYHPSFGVKQRILILERGYPGYTDETELNLRLDWMGILPAGATNFIMFLIFIGMMFNIDSRDTGKGVLLIGFIFLVVNVFIIKDLFILVAGSIMPLLFIVFGVLMEWNHRKGK